MRACCAAASRALDEGGSVGSSPTCARAPWPMATTHLIAATGCRSLTARGRSEQLLPLQL